MASVKDLTKAIAALADGGMVNVPASVAKTINKTLESAIKAVVAARRYQAQINIWARYGKQALGTATDEEIDREIARMDAKKALDKDENTLDEVEDGAGI